MSTDSATTMSIAARDLTVLRRLAARKVQIAADPLNLERRRLWYDHDAAAGGRPMVLAESGGVRDAIRPLPDEVLECSDAWARGLERGLRTEIYQFEVLRDDHVVEPRFCTNWRVQIGNYGVEVVYHHSDAEVTLGARSWDPPLRNLDEDLERLQARSFSVDRQATWDEVERLEAVFDGLLEVEIRGGFWWTLGMTWTVIELIGLEHLMLNMYDDPEGLHRLMAFLRDDHLALASHLEAEGLLNRNDENDYIGSGSMGYSRALPQADGIDHTRQCDQWVLLESQETVGVGPEQFETFIFPYQRDIASHFGRCYYGCCEPVHSRIHALKKLPGLARVSVSPWADEEIMAEQLGRDLVFSRKPNPTLISTPVFDEDQIAADLRHTLEVARGCRVELIMKDVHTLCNQPQRLCRWVELARQSIDEVWR